MGMNQAEPGFLLALVGFVLFCFVCASTSDVFQDPLLMQENSVRARLLTPAVGVERVVFHQVQQFTLVTVWHSIHHCISDK